MTTALAQATCHAVPYRYSPIALFLAGNTGNFTEPDKQYTLYQDSTGTTPVTAVEQGIGRISDTSGSGNHLIQATGASEPVWSKRYNLDTYSEDFRNTADAGAARPTVYVRATITPNAANDPLGNATMDKIVEDATATNTHYIRRSYAAAGFADNTYYTFVRYLKAAERSWAYMLVLTKADPGGKGAYFDLTNGVTGTVDAGATATITHVGGGIYRCTITRDIGSGANTPACDVRLATGNNGHTYSGDGTSGAYVWGADYRAGQITTLPYQWINAATDYDTAGFLPYIKADGVDDSFTCATGAGSTTGFSFQMGLVLEGAAAAQTIYSEAGTNTGIKIERDASNQIVLSGGDGVAYTTATSAAQVAGTGFVLSCFYTGSNLIIQINKNAPVTVPFSTLSAGTTSWTMYKANGAASGYLLGRDYGHAMYKDYVLTDAEKNAGIEFFAAKMGITV